MKICKLMTVLVVLFSFQTALAIGVTRPIPYDVELMRGESADFSFEIQAVTSQDRISCDYSVDGMDPLTIKFDSDEVIVDAGSTKMVYGTVTVPENTPFGTYSGRVSVSCGAAQEGGESGSQVKTSISGSPFNVEVVDAREREIREVRPKEEGAPAGTIILIIAALIVIIGAYYFYTKSGKKPKALPESPAKKKKSK